MLKVATAEEGKEQIDDTHETQKGTFNRATEDHHLVFLC